MINWFRQKIHHWTRDRSDDIEDCRHSVRLSSGYIRLDFYIADGGYVIESIIYDKVKDEDLVNLYIIKEDENLGDRISKIITSEKLKLH